MSINDYWDSTIDEINIVLEAKNKRDKEMLINRYESSKLNAYFISLAIGGQDIPDIDEVYPDIFENDILAQADSDAAIKAYEKLIAMLAVAVNNSRKGK